MDESVRITAEIPVVRPDASGAPRRDIGRSAWAQLETADVASDQSAPPGLRHAVLGLGLASLLALGGFVALHVQPRWFAVLRNTLASPRQKAHASTTLPTTAASTTTNVVHVAGHPAIYSIVPTSGTAGDTVSLVGADLFSTDGQLVVLFGQTPAVTRCADEQHCSAVVPALASSNAAVKVRIRSAAGNSNSLEFRYR